MSIQIIWATGREHTNDWEYTWISELFKDIPVNFITLTNLKNIYTNAIIVFNHNIPYIQYISQYEALNIPFGLIHLSDEYINDPIYIYDFNNCKFVLRNYYRKEYKNNSKVLQFPLGYKNGLWENNEPLNGLNQTIQDRNYTWSFAGGMRKNRESAIELFKDNLSNHRLVIEKGNSFNHVLTGLSTRDYRNLMLDSKFVLCPDGNVSVDSFRIYEALECGAIPIVLSRNKFQWIEDSSYWKVITHADEEPPFIMNDTMDENLAEVKRLLENIDLLEEKRKACWLFWQKAKDRIKYLISEKIKQL